MNAVDLTTKLPAEVLCQVLSNISSLSDSFKVAGVNRKFRRCMLVEMKKPQPLEMNFYPRRLCGRTVPFSQWLSAIEVLAKEARFNRIWIYRLCGLSFRPLFHQIMQALVANPDCLSHVTEVRVEILGLFLGGSCVDGLDSVIAKCHKLSILELDFMNIPLRFRSDPYVNRDDHPSLDLCPILHHKSVSQLNLQLANYTQQDVIDLFRSLKPNTLRDLTMSLKKSLGPLNVAHLVRELCLTAGESLEAIHLRGCPVRGLSHVALFNCVARLPALRRLFVIGEGLHHHHQFIAAVKSLLSNHTRATQLIVQLYDYELDKFPGCQLLAWIRQLKQELPDMAFGFDHSIGRMKLSLGNVAFGLHRFNSKCSQSAPLCVVCRSCYPVVKNELVLKALSEESGHIEDYWLNRCAISHVLEGLADLLFHNRICWKNIRLEENQTHDLATITIERHNRTQAEITVKTGRCFSSSCTGC